MSRIAPVISSNDSKVASTLSQLKASLGMVPNLFATMANSSAALDGYLGLKKTLSRGRLTDRQREIVSLAVGQEDECQYCLSAHTQLSKAAGLSEAGALKARHGDGDDPFESALASFAKEVVRQRGHISDEVLEKRAEGGDRRRSGDGDHCERRVEYADQLCQRGCEDRSRLSGGGGKAVMGVISLRTKSERRER